MRIKVSIYVLQFVASHWSAELINIEKMAKQFIEDCHLFILLLSMDKTNKKTKTFFKYYI